MEEILDYSYPLVPLILSCTKCAQCKEQTTIHANAASIQQVCKCGNATLDYVNVTMQALHGPIYIIVPFVFIARKVNNTVKVAFYSPQKNIKHTYTQDIMNQRGQSSIAGLRIKIQARYAIDNDTCFVPVIISNDSGCQLMSRYCMGADSQQAMLVQTDPDVFNKHMTEYWAIASIILDGA